MCADRMLSPSVLIGPCEDESVSVMRLEKNSSIHNLTECVFDAVQHGNCSPYSFSFQIFFYKSIYGPLVWEVDVARVPVRNFPTVHGCAEDGGLPRQSSI